MHADITIQPGGHGTIHVGGHDLSNAVRGFTLNASVGEMTRLELDLVLVKDGKLSGEVDVYIPPATVELLERLGWTPPNGGRE